MTSPTYTDLLKRRAVQRFVKENRRAPTKAELRELVRVELAAYPTVDEVGVSGEDIVRPRFLNESSAAVEQKNRQALYDDMETINKRLGNLNTLLEDSYRGFYATVSRLEHLISKEEARVDKLLLLNSNVDVFTHGVEEFFDVSDKVVFDETTASIENGYCTLARSGMNKVNLSQAVINVSAISDGTIISYGATAKTDALREADGDVYEYMVYTREALSRTTMVIDIKLEEPTYIQQIELTGLPVQGNKQATVTIAYSTDGTSYAIHEPAERSMRQETTFDLGQDGVQRVQIRISKNAADIKTTGESQWVTFFSIDSINLYTDTYKNALESVVVLGPYDIVDCEGRDIFYTKATLSPCTVEPEGTSISWYLSANGVDWTGIDTSGDASSIFNAADGSASQSVGFVDAMAAPGSLVEAVAGLQFVHFGTEAVLNTYIDSAYVDKVPTRTMKICRNIPQNDEVLSESAGWSFDPSTNRYSTVAYVSDPAGRWIDFGPSAIIVAGQELTGRVFFAQGYTEVLVDDKNWIKIDETYTSVDELKSNDPLYPYNHKYLIEGYGNDVAFPLERVYKGVDNYFASLLTYLPLEEFSLLTEEDSNYWKSFTLISDAAGDLYIKVKVDKTDSTWVNELYNLDWAVQGGPSNQIYVRAIMTTDNVNVGPVIDSFNIRVI